MSTQDKLGNALYEGLVNLHKQKGALKIEDVSALLEQVSATFHPSENIIENGFVEEMQKLADYIKQTKQEILVIAATGNDKSDGAALHLDAVIKATEAAGNTIMDAADSIQAAAANVDKNAQQSINQAITKIYEACNFQDITCQRLTKVIKILDEVDLRVANVLKLFGGQPVTMSTVVHKATKEEELLNGPQLPDSAPSQADIDAMFATIKP